MNVSADQVVFQQIGSISVQCPDAQTAASQQILAGNARLAENDVADFQFLRSIFHGLSTPFS